ncbi:glutathione S-transferase family protein [Aestuariibius sp. 2305UL40-4]|uniref:glutathione S-transferase family protein n=1 Tax=Aestuariibius violaceus TaxID=3234132 RepID=UPI00345E6573
MTGLVLTTLAWVPDFPRGYVRDLRVRWALEEAGLPYSVRTVSGKDRGAEHLARQPFGQVPILTDGDITLFESGAILVHLGLQTPVLMPEDPKGRAEVLQWVFAAVNSVETAALPRIICDFAKDDTRTPGREALDTYLTGRLDGMEAVLATRDWLAGRFSIADILMADAFRLFDGTDILADHPACQGYVDRATARPAFQKALADQLAHFAAADAQIAAPAGAIDV